MELDVEKLYRDNSSPLEEIDQEDLKENDTFITSKGNRFRRLKDGNFIMLQSSCMVEGELVEDLTPKQLKLYWKLMNYKERQ